jgi:hypothetical protein
MITFRAGFSEPFLRPRKRRIYSAFIRHATQAWPGLSALVYESNSPILTARLFFWRKIERHDKRQIAATASFP